MLCVVTKDNINIIYPSCKNSVFLCRIGWLHKMNKIEMVPYDFHFIFFSPISNRQMDLLSNFVLFFYARESPGRPRKSWLV